jgi:hypothetical protein
MRLDNSQRGCIVFINPETMWSLTDGVAMKHTADLRILKDCKTFSVNDYEQLGGTTGIRTISGGGST